jgi:hypothetical protein
MANRNFSFENPEAFYLIEMDDDSVLADGMIPDSRIIGLIDELGATGRYESDADDEDPGLTLESLGVQYDEDE